MSGAGGPPSCWPRPVKIWCVMSSDVYVLSTQSTDHTLILCCPRTICSWKLVDTVNC